MSEANSHSSISDASSSSSSLGDHGVEDNSVSQNVHTDRNLLFPGDAIHQASATIPRTPTSMSSSSLGGHSTLRVARVIPTTRSVTNSPAEEHRDSNYSSGDDSESGGAANPDEEGSDLGGSHQDFQQARREHRSIRLMQNTRQRQAARVIPRRYASFRLHQFESELFVCA